MGTCNRLHSDPISVHTQYGEGSIKCYMNINLDSLGADVALFLCHNADKRYQW